MILSLFSHLSARVLLNLSIITELFVGITRYFDIAPLLSQRTEGKLAHYEGMNVDCHYKLLPLVFSECPTYRALEVVRLILR